MVVMSLPEGRNHIPTVTSLRPKVVHASKMRTIYKNIKKGKGTFGKLEPLGGGNL